MHLCGHCACQSSTQATVIMSKSINLGRLVYYATCQDAHEIIMQFLEEDDKAFLWMSRATSKARIKRVLVPGLLRNIADMSGLLRKSVMSIVGATLRLIACKQCGLRPQCKYMDIWEKFKLVVEPCIQDRVDDDVYVYADAHATGSFCEICGSRRMIALPKEYSNVCPHYLPHFTYGSSEFTTARYVSIKQLERVKYTMQHQGYIACLHCPRVVWGEVLSHPDCAFVTQRAEKYILDTKTMMPDTMTRCLARLMPHPDSDIRSRDVIRPTPHYAHRSGRVWEFTIETTEWQDLWACWPPGEPVKTEPPHKRQRCS